MIDLMTMKTFFANFSENKNSLSNTSLEEFLGILSGNNISGLYIFFLTCVYQYLILVKVNLV